MKLREVAIALHSMELNIQETKCFKKLFFLYTNGNENNAFNMILFNRLGFMLLVFPMRNCSLKVSVGILQCLDSLFLSHSALPSHMCSGIS